MSSYTIELRKLCELLGRDEVESWFKSYNIEDYLLPEQLEIIDKSPIFNKDKLATKIVDNFFMREIAFETAGLFELQAKNFMDNIMCEKLPIIYSMSLEYNPLINVDYTETYESQNEGKVSSNGSNTSKADSLSKTKSITSDTPQKKIDYDTIENGFYASETAYNENSSDMNNTTTNNSFSNSNSKDNYIRHFTGNQGISATYQAMIKQFRENIRNINLEIFQELEPLFMGLF